MQKTFNWNIEQHNWSSSQFVLDMLEERQKLLIDDEAPDLLNIFSFIPLDILKDKDFIIQAMEIYSKFVFDFFDHYQDYRFHYLSQRCDYNNISFYSTYLLEKEVVEKQKKTIYKNSINFEPSINSDFNNEIIGIMENLLLEINSNNLFYFDSIWNKNLSEIYYLYKIPEEFYIQQALVKKEKLNEVWIESPEGISINQVISEDYQSFKQQYSQLIFIIDKYYLNLELYDYIVEKEKKGIINDILEIKYKKAYFTKEHFRDLIILNHMYFCDNDHIKLYNYLPTELKMQLNVVEFYQKIILNFNFDIGSGGVNSKQFYSHCLNKNAIPLEFYQKYLELDNNIKLSSHVKGLICYFQNSIYGHNNDIIMDYFFSKDKFISSYKILNKENSYKRSPPQSVFDYLYSTNYLQDKDFCLSLFNEDGFLHKEDRISFISHIPSNIIKDHDIQKKILEITEGDLSVLNLPFDFSLLDIDKDIDLICKLVNKQKIFNDSILPDNIKILWRNELKIALAAKEGLVNIDYSFEEWEKILSIPSNIKLLQSHTYGGFINAIPQQLHTKEIILLGLQFNPNLIEDLYLQDSVFWQDKQFCIDSLGQSHSMIKYIPKQFWNDLDFITSLLDLIDQDKYPYNNLFKYLPNEIQQFFQLHCIYEQYSEFFTNYSLAEHLDQNLKFNHNIKKSKKI